MLFQRWSNERKKNQIERILREICVLSTRICVCIRIMHAYSHQYVHFVHLFIYTISCLPYNSWSERYSGNVSAFDVHWAVSRYEKRLTHLCFYCSPRMMNLQIAIATKWTRSFSLCFGVAFHFLMSIVSNAWNFHYEFVFFFHNSLFTHLISEKN